jgi:hypothetical protein
MNSKVRGVVGPRMSLECHRPGRALPGYLNDRFLHMPFRITKIRIIDLDTYKDS